MNKTYLIFKHEFLREIKRISFIIMTLAVPVLTLLAIGVMELVTTLSTPTEKVVKAIGYVDEVGIFDNYTSQGLTKLIPFSSKLDATRALVKREVAEYIIIPADYTTSGSIKRFTP